MIKEGDRPCGEQNAESPLARGEQALRSSSRRERGYTAYQLLPSGSALIFALTFIIHPPARGVRWAPP
jgi:hypothetical protein